MRLRGTMITGDRGVASIEVEGEGGTRTVPQGRELFGYVLAEVHRDHVIFRPRESQDKVVLYLERDDGTYAAPQPLPVDQPVLALPEPELTITTASTGNTAVRVDFLGSDGGPYARVGLQSGDVVLSMDGQPVTSDSQLRSLIVNPGVLEIERGGQPLTLNQAAAPPSEPDPAQPPPGSGVPETTDESPQS